MNLPAVTPGVENTPKHVCFGNSAADVTSGVAWLFGCSVTHACTL